MQDLHQFFALRHFIENHEHLQYDPLQWGAQLQFATQNNFDFSDADIVLLGCGEMRGNQADAAYSAAPDAIRKELYQLYNWHPSIKIADLGNLLQGASLNDSRAALRTVLQELQEAGKIVILLGGTQDLSLQQYEAFKNEQKVINAVVADALIDLDESETITDRSYLMDMLTGTPNFVQHYTHLGFQSYYVHPQILETLDKLRFDFLRVGKLREHLDEAEPALREAQLFSIDLNVVRFSDSPANANGSPNGLAGDEICALTRFAGAGAHMNSLGFYGYDPKKDVQAMSAKLIAQMIWYFVDGCLLRRQEADWNNREEFAEFHVRFSSNDTLFLKSRRTNRWWMELPNGTFIPCTLADYQQASRDEIPERWLRSQERL
ncbi:MAG: arginase family protein [Bacteroidetes bacterium]|nr:arginase family protein [Bacteroidota bacterium]